MAWVIPSCEAGQQSETAEHTAVKRINITLGAGDNSNQSNHCKIKTDAENKQLASKRNPPTLQFMFCYKYWNVDVWESVKNGIVNTPFRFWFHYCNYTTRLKVSRPVKCHRSKHVFCVVCHRAKWSLGLMSRCREHKHSNWEVKWVTGMSTQAKKHRAAGVMKTRSIGHISAARKKILLYKKKERPQ